MDSRWFSLNWYDISSLVKNFHNTNIEHKNIEKRDFIFEIYFNQALIC